MKIREATKDDYKEIMKLYGGLVKNQKRFANGDNDSYSKVLADPQSHIDVAIEIDKIIGFISYSARTVVRYPAPIVEVEEFYVVPRYRRRGVGKKLMQRVIDFTRNKKHHYIFLSSAKDLEAAHKFYKATDFDEYALHFRKKP